MIFFLVDVFEFDIIGIVYGGIFVVCYEGCVVFVFDMIFGECVCVCVIFL